VHFKFDAMAFTPIMKDEPFPGRAPVDDDEDDDVYIYGMGKAAAAAAATMHASSSSVATMHASSSSVALPPPQPPAAAAAGRARFARAPAPETPLTLVLVDPLLCRLHRFTALVAGVLGCSAAEVLGDFRDIVPSETSLDRTYLTRVGRGAYLMASALYRVQNQLCLNRLRLYHIIQYDEWTARFLVLLQCICTPKADEREAVAWFDRQHTFDSLPAATTPVTYTPVPTVPQSTHDWVREALFVGWRRRRRRYGQHEVELATTLALAALGSPRATLARVTRALHGRAEFARLAAAMITPKATPVDVTWLRGFLDRDCACAF
jgi:hypothetical protein